MDISGELHPSDLMAGDILLHRGSGQLSKLIAWVGDSPYSHAAVVYDGEQLLEAGATGVHFASLAQRMQMVTAFEYIDVYRPSPLQTADRASRLALLQTALGVYLGRPYPMSSLAMLGITCAIRNKIPGTPELRLCIRMAFDLVIANDPNQMVCSELVYRGFDEAAAMPAHALRLPVIIRPPRDTPLPPIDLLALAQEYMDDYRRSGHPVPVVASPMPMATAGNDLLDDVEDNSNRVANEQVDTMQLMQRLYQARAQLGLDSTPLLRGSLGSEASTDLTDPLPNPKTVLPADLQFSPGVQLVGRLMMAAA